MSRTDPISVYKFWVEVDGIVSGYFTECSGLTIQRQTEDHKEGGINDYVHKLPGRLQQSNITLKRGLADEALWSWFVKGLTTLRVERRSVTILLYNNDHTQIKRWNLHQAYPIKWQGPDLKTDSTQVALESIELVHQGLEMTGWTPA